jgi:hypothetical protein
MTDRCVECGNIHQREYRPGLSRRARRLQEGKIGWILLWAVGVPIPLLLLVFVLRGCT